MEEEADEINRRIEERRIKSSPGYIECMKNVYLYFKEEKERGILKIPINGFLERTAVACGVGRKMLYTYAKRGLFDENPPTLLEEEEKNVRKVKTSDKIQVPKKRRKKRATCIATNTGPSSCPTCVMKKTSSSSEKASAAKTKVEANFSAGSSAVQTINGNTSDGVPNFPVKIKVENDTNSEDEMVLEDQITIENETVIKLEPPFMS